MVSNWVRVALLVPLKPPVVGVPVVRLVLPGGFAGWARRWPRSRRTPADREIVIGGVVLLNHDHHTRCHTGCIHRGPPLIETPGVTTPICAPQLPVPQGVDPLSGPHSGASLHRTLKSDWK